MASGTLDQLLCRTVKILGANAGSPHNRVTTAKFSLLSFFPKSLYLLLAPHKRFANFYFLCVGALQCIPQISLTGGAPSTWLTLSVLVLVDMILMAREDLARHRADRASNAQKVDILSGSGGADQFVRSTWADVRCGDVLRIFSREAFPADMILLRGSDPPGQCWVNTKPLDGESDTKLRLAPKATSTVLAQWTPIELRKTLAGSVRCEAPNDKVNDFVGQLCLDGREPALVSEDNMLLRGCQLRNTDWVLGLVVATGGETKINYGGGGEGVVKVGHTAQLINQDIKGVIAWLMLVCLIGGVANAGARGGYAETEPWYLSEADQGAAPFTMFVETVFTFFLLNYQFIPVSLYVSMNMIFLISAGFVRNDLEVYDAAQDEPCQVRSMSLLDELGQVSHVFSDKTGTLTSNLMAFRRLKIGGTTYGCGDTAISRSLRANAATPASDPVLSRRAVPPFGGCKESTAMYVGFDEEEGARSIFDDLQEGGESGAGRREFMLHMALNHSVLLEVVAGRQELSASSPDEQAFVAAAEYFGFEFLERDVDAGTLTVLDRQSDTKHVVQILEVFPYESSRKRMSIIVRLPPALIEAVGGGCAVRLYCKGADSPLLDMLELGGPGTDRQPMEALSQLLFEWADIALRTLIWCKHELPDFDAWHARYRAATADPVEVQKLKLGQSSRILELQAEVEGRFTLMGASAIEDKLQDGVPEVLADLRSAGVKVWMLTGDKAGTAKNIATACNILPPDADTLEITTETFPVLGDVKTAELIGPQQKLRAAEAALRAARGGGALRRRLRGGARADAAAAALRAALKQETAALDAAHPELRAVREALEARRHKMSAQLDGELQSVATARGADAAPDGAQQASVGDGDGAPGMCMVLDEKAIEYCGALCADVLAAVGNGCRSVVACRARKDQKAQMLNLIRDNVPGSCCLAIGDGANDVAMIKAGHIGVGIIGKEGMAAVNNSDFAIGQFRFLRGLLLVHGRFNYRRMSIFAVYMFYKNIANVLAMYFYTLTAMASGGRLFLTVYIELYNIVYTAFPIILFGISNQDVPKAVSAATPSLYTAGILRVYYTHASFWRWMLEATVTALLAAYVPMACLGVPGLSLPTARGNAEYHALAFTSMTLVVLCTNLRLALELHSWGWLEHSVMWLTCPVFLELSLLLYSEVAFPFEDLSSAASFDWGSFSGLLPQLYAQFAWWMCVLLTVVLVIGPRFIAKSRHALAAGSAVKAVRRQIEAAKHHRNREVRRSVNQAFMSVGGRSKDFLGPGPVEMSPPVLLASEESGTQALCQASSSDSPRENRLPRMGSTSSSCSHSSGKEQHPVPLSATKPQQRKESRVPRGSIVSWSTIRSGSSSSTKKSNKEGYAYSADTKTTNAIWSSMGLLPHLDDSLSLQGDCRATQEQREISRTHAPAPSVAEEPAL